MSEEQLLIRECTRDLTLEDLTVRSDGSGRVIEAYAAAFRTASGQAIRQEVIDQEGHYREQLAPGSFTKTVQERGLNFGVLFNHAKTIHGTPNPEATMPIGVPLEVTPDERGVYTVTKYLENPLADRALNAIKEGAIKAQSFSGRFIKSVRTYPEGRTSGALPLITRHEIDMREYGPAVFAAYPDAAILGSRTVDLFFRALLATPPDQRAEFLQNFEGLTTPALLEPEALTIGTPPGAAAADEPATRHSAQQFRDRIRAARKSRGME